IENRTGAGGNIGTEAVVRAPADGYTLHLTATSDAINATLYDKLNFNLLRDITPVAGLIRGPFVMVVNSSFQAKTVVEFIAYAKANLRQDQFCGGRYRVRVACLRRDVQDDGRSQHGPCAVSWPGSRNDRSPQRPSASHVRPCCFVDHAHPGRQAAALGYD